jgi:hypothetical protein
MKIIIAALMLLASLTAAIAFGLGEQGIQFGHEGKMPDFTPAAVPGCASPTAPNGQIDLSQCSNAFYVAVIL